MSAPTIRPELAEVLERVSRSPRAKLFVTTPRQLVLGLRGAIDLASARETDLSSAERHLLATHRDELGDLLTDACLSALQRHPKGAHSFRPYFADPPPPEHWEVLVERTRDLGAKDLGDRPPELPLAIDYSDPATLAVLALRIRPSTRARQALGLTSCLVLGQLTSAKRIFHDLAQHQPDDQVACCALTNLALCHELSGDLESGLSVCHAAIDKAPRPQVVANRLVTSLRLGRYEDALDCARLANGSPSILAQLSQPLEGMKCRIGDGRFTPGPLQLALDKADDALGPCGEMLRNALG